MTKKREKRDLSQCLAVKGKANQRMKAKGISGSGIPNKKYDNQEIYELIHITNCFPELKKKEITASSKNCNLVRVCLL